MKDIIDRLSRQAISPSTHTFTHHGRSSSPSALAVYGPINVCLSGRAGSLEVELATPHLKDLDHGNSGTTLLSGSWTAWVRSVKTGNNRDERTLFGCPANVVAHSRVWAREEPGLEALR